MLCSKCKKRVAVVFITRMENGQTLNEGVCLKCAADLGIKPVNDIIEQMGLTPGDIENAEGELMRYMGEAQEEGLVPESDRGFDDDLEGGAQTFPFIKGLFGGNRESDGGQNPQGPNGGRRKTDKNQSDTEEKSGGRKKEPKRKYLETYGINLTERARNGELDRIIGREDEIYRVVQILNRRTKNNPCLIGEPGVGKTAVAEGLAQRIAAEMVPAKLADKEVYLLDLAALVAGTQFRGQFESRIKNLIEEVRNLGNIILVIDEVHNLVGAGEAEGAMNAANILKPALSRGEIQVIGATTFSEYRKYIEKDAALERRFQPVTIEEPSIDDTTEIMRGIKSYYEEYHGVTISDETVRQAVELSERYITDRYLPDKAIDLIDEAASGVNMEDQITNEIIRKTRELDEILEEQGELEPDGTAEIYEKIAALRAEELRISGELTVLKDSSKPLILTENDLAKVVGRWTGIPVSKIEESEFAKLQNLENKLKERIVGQDEAIKSLVSAIMRNRVGISPKKKPVSFIFTGPTGVGKTELVRTVAAELFDSPETMIRLDMSEFMEKHSVSRIIGAPPGYVGYDEAGQLTEKIRRKPYSVILFDEIEKAHPDVLNILLQILDDGRITDAHGKVVNFENTIIVMTSNAGSDKKSGVVGFGGRTGEDTAARDKSMKALEEFLRPEFINRVDEICTFRGLDRDDFDRIARIMLGDLANTLAAKGRSLVYDDEVVKLLVEKSFSEKYGARNIRRTIEKGIEDRIATLIVENRDRNIPVITVTAMGDEFAVIG